MTPYQEFLLDNITLERPLRVGIDAGNGTAGLTSAPIIKGLGCEVHDLYCDLDGTFPNHEADPTVLKNMTEVIALVKENNLDVGFGYDGDGDRIGVVDEKGAAGPSCPGQARCPGGGGRSPRDIQFRSPGEPLPLSG